MTDTANLALDLMMIFFALLALGGVVALCGLPAILRSFDVDLAKLDSHLGFTNPFPALKVSSLLTGWPDFTPAGHS